MPITINGSGTIGGVSVGGLPDGIVDSDTLAANTAGRILQVVQVQDGAYTTGTGTIPLTSIPQNTNGTEFMSLAITPTSATSKLMINVNALVSCSIGSIYIVGALFQDSTADALAVWEAYPTGAAAPVGLNFTHYMTAGTTSATTFKFRAGATSAATTNFNGGSSTGHGGGVMASSIIITEIAA